MDGSGYTDCIGFVDWKGGVNASFLVIYQHGTNHGLCFYNVTELQADGKISSPIIYHLKDIRQNNELLKISCQQFH